MGVKLLVLLSQVIQQFVCVFMISLTVWYKYSASFDWFELLIFETAEVPFP